MSLRRRPRARKVLDLAGLRQITAGIGTLDAELFETIARSPSPLLDRTMPVLTRAADHSVLWLAIAGAMAATGNRTAERAAARGVATVGVTSLFTNQVAKRLRRRPRPIIASVPLARRSAHLPTSNSFPSGHSASAAAFATAVALESPPMGLALGALAGLVGLSRVATGAHYPGDVVIGLGIGAAVAVIGGRLVPPIQSPTTLQLPAPLRMEPTPRPDGRGVVVVANPNSGSGTGARVLPQIRRDLPEATIIEVDGSDDMAEVLREAASRADVLAIAGGDGTVATAAAAAIDADIPLAVFPAGTFNHFARDIGCATTADTIRAITTGSVTRVDVAYLNDERVIINTASIGAYPHFVHTRERLQRRISKPLAGAYAMLHTFLRDPSVRISVDGRQVRTSLFLVGNSRYYPSGFAPSRRLRLDDGLLDVRILESGSRFGALRLMGSLAFGRLERSRLYHEAHVPEFSFTTIDAPTMLAHDGEIGESLESAKFRAAYRALQVFSTLV